MFWTDVLITKFYANVSIKLTYCLKMIWRAWCIILVSLPWATVHWVIPGNDMQILIFVRTNHEIVVTQLVWKHMFPLCQMPSLTLLHSERPKLYTILAFLSAIGLNMSDII